MKNVTSKCDKIYPADKYILSHAKELDYSFCYMNFPRYKPKYIRNRFMKLKKDGKIIPLQPRSCPRYYILKEWKYRYIHQTAKNVTTDPILVRSDNPVEVKRVWTSFSAFLESLPPVDLAHIHDVHLNFSSADLDFVGDEWEWEERSKSWHHHYECDDGWGYTVSAYSTTKTVTVAVKCKFYYSICGLLQLILKLGEVKAQLGDVPNPRSWRVSMWHYGKDLAYPIRGRDFEVCFGTFSGCLGRIYYKNDLAVVRFEEIHTPNKPLQEIFEEVVKNEA